MRSQALDYAEAGERHVSYVQLAVALKRIGEWSTAQLGNANEASDSGFQAACRHPNAIIHG